MLVIIGIGIILSGVWFYKWLNANNDYFEKKGIKYTKQNIMDTVKIMTSRDKSIAEIVQLMYNSGNEKISGRFQLRTPTYFVRDPKLAKRLAVKDFDYFADHRAIMDDSVDKMFGKSLISLKGQKWRDMRATLSPMFTGSKMRMMYNLVADVGKQTAQTMKDQIKSTNDNIFEFRALATKFTVDVIATCAFGIEVNSFKEPENAFARIANSVTDFSNWKTGLKFLGYLMMAPVMKAFGIRIFSKEVDKFFKEAVIDTMNIREEKGIIRHDIINLLMQVRKGNLSHETKETALSEGFATVEESQVGKSQVKQIWDDEDLAAQGFLFFFAGFDTISTTMSFMAHEITVNPEIQQKLYEEIEAMEAELDGKTISYEKIQRLKYMDQVVSETLRKWPVVAMIDRLCVKEYRFQMDDLDFTIEKDRAFLIPVLGYHRDPNYYPDPMKFDPERFSDENKHNIDPDTYLPFGIGPRNCIGSRFALMEMKTMFYYLLKNFSFEVTAKTQIPLQLEKSLINIKPEKGVHIALKPRA